MGEFATGDVVSLRSGGPAMTVVGTVVGSDHMERYENVGARYRCVWLTADGQSERDEFPALCLVKVPMPELRRG